ncbi:hypothetical protein [Kaarinaea lacus]
MENQHPSADELYSYMDAPEAPDHTGLRYHLMSCAYCRSQIDKLSQLEINVKNFLPRIATAQQATEDSEHSIEHFVDQQFDGVNNLDMEAKIKSDPARLKAALHYAVHSTAMNKQTQNAVQAPDRANKPASSILQSTGINNFFNRVKLITQWPMPAWTLAPASFAIAALISFVLVANTNARQHAAQIAAYQDDATITFTKTDMPAGSIGFFHDAQSSRQAFSGISIKATQHGKNNATRNASDLEIQWPAVKNAKSYELEIYFYQNSEKQLLAQQTTRQPSILVKDVILTNGQHYQWMLSGVTDDGQKFHTTGDFVYLKNKNPESDGSQ